MERSRLQEIIERFPRLSIGLVGDLFLDRYLECEGAENSLETGLPAYQVTNVRHAAGAIGTVASNLYTLNVREIFVVSCVGRDGAASDLEKVMPPCRSHVLYDDSRLTPIYTKPILGGRELSRLDVRTREPLRPGSHASLAYCVREMNVGGVIVVDQVPDEFGVVDERMRRELSRVRVPMLVDSRSRLGKFPYGILKGNQTEFATVAPDPDLCDRQGFRTLGEGGIVVYDHGDRTFVPAVEMEGPIDTCGAGDAVSAALMASMLAGASPVEAAEVAMLAASVTIQKIHQTGTASPAEILAAHERTLAHAA